MTAWNVPAAHRALLEGRYNAALTTVMPDGMPHTTPVWFLLEGAAITLNTMREFQKTKNMRANPRVTLLIYDPRDPFTNLELRGTVIEMTEEGALAHLDKMTQHYLDKEEARFFGDSVPAEQQERFHPVRVVVQPTRIRTEGGGS